MCYLADFNRTTHDPLIVEIDHSRRRICLVYETRKAGP
jgi:hypothetical protein